MTDPPPAARADARRNRDVILAAARAEIAQHGLGVSTNAIVRRAGVGPATFYRRFGSRQALLAAVLTDLVERIEGEVEHAVARSDPFEALQRLMTVLVEEQAENRGLGELLSATGDDEVLVSLHQARARVCSAMRKATERARDAGVISGDVVWQDLPFIAGAVAATPATCLGLQGGPDMRGRVLTAVLDGLRACPDRA